jgi:hypothetical protein
VLPYDEYLQIEQALRHLEGALAPTDPRYGGFWENLPAEELAKRQGVVPASCAEDLYGNGDPSDWDGFDEALEQWRAEEPLS